jgi:hypothetical protein
MHAAHYDASHHWADTAGGFCLTLKVANKNIQLYINYLGTNLYLRTKWDSWGSWKQVVFTT